MSLAYRRYSVSIQVLCLPEDLEGVKDGNWAGSSLQLERKTPGFKPLSCQVSACVTLSTISEGNPPSLERFRDDANFAEQL